MIGHLRGTLLERGAGGVVIDCGGVGYQVSLSGHSLSQIGATGQPMSMRIFTHFQKNDGSITLYGFTSSEERTLFDLLITVKNVGPASAIKILSAGSSPEDIAQLIAGGRTATLKGLRGVGKKTAELLVVELRERCEELILSWGKRLEAATSGGQASYSAKSSIKVRAPVLEDVASALGQLGWRPVEVDKAIEQLSPTPEATFEGLLRQALRSMPR